LFSVTIVKVEVGINSWNGHSIFPFLGFSMTAIKIK